MAVTFSEPFALMLASSLSKIVDMQAAPYCIQSSGSFPNSVLQLQPYSSGNSAQKFVYGSDQRIYLASSTTTGQCLCIDVDTTPGSTAQPAPGNALILSYVNDRSTTQQWNPYQYGAPSTYVEMVSYPQLVIDDFNANITAGNKVQVWGVMPNNTAQLWVAWSGQAPWGSALAK